MEDTDSRQMRSEYGTATSSAVIATESLHQRVDIATKGAGHSGWAQYIQHELQDIPARCILVSSDRIALVEEAEAQREGRERMRG